MTSRAAAVLLGAALLSGAAVPAGVDCLDGPLTGVVFRSSPGRDGEVLYDLQVRNGSRDARIALTIRFVAPGVREAARDEVYALNPQQGLRTVLGRGTREMSEAEMRAATTVRCRAF